MIKLGATAYPGTDPILSMQKISIKQVPAVQEETRIASDFQLDPPLAETLHAMEHSNDTLFITGKAGTGKSSLLNFFRKNTKKKYVVLASTGLAAIHVGGNTIHSFFGFPLRTMILNDPDIRKWGKAHPKYKIIKNMDTLIIDEVSMVRADLLDAIDECLRLNLDSDLCFGGKQVIFVGDVFQLSPVMKNGEHGFNGEDRYESPYFFSAAVFRKVMPKVIELKKIYRQQQEDFIYLLNRIRNGMAGQDEINEINKKCDFKENGNQDFAICLTAVNALSDKVNQDKLQALSSSLFKFDGAIQGLFNEKNLPVEYQLQLKSGAQVMMAKNDLFGRWVNGSIGRIISITQKQIKVEFENNIVHAVDPVIWENRTYKWDEETKTILSEVVGTFTQYPIKLAWSITIHKSQGLTFDKVIIDMGKGAFAHGQLYVALSRCKTWEGISLKTMLKPTDVIVDEAVEYFASRYLNN